MSMSHEAYDWADVEEPTDAELAEVDAALAEHEPCVVTDESMGLWAHNAKVRLALRVAGLPDSQPDWLERFSSALFTITEATEKLGIDALLQAGSAWERFRARPFEKGGVGTKGGSNILYQFLSVGMSIECLAAYLNESEYTVCRHITTAHPHTLPEADRLLRRGDVTLVEITRRTGISRDRLAAYANKCGIVTASQRKFEGRAPAEVRSRALQLHAEGVGTTSIARKLEVEFPDLYGITKHAIHKWIIRAA